MAVKKSKVGAEKAKKSNLSKQEIENLVLEMAKKDTPLAKIGLILKKEHGVSKAKLEVGKIGKIIEKNKIKRFPEELKNLMEKARKLREHHSKNKKDTVSKRGIQMTDAKIRNLAAYFKRSKVLDKVWEYAPEVK